MRLATLILSLAVFFTPLFASGNMSSANYNIYADSFSSGGGNSTGGDYNLDDIIAQSLAGDMSGGVYDVNGGYLSAVSSSISLSLDTASVNLGTLAVATVSSGSVVATVTTDSDGGYSLSTGAVSGTSITAVADGAVTAGTEEYGLSVSGTGSTVTGDVAVTASLALATAAAPVYNRGITITFKASISNDSVEASYAQTVPLIAAPNF